MMLRRTILAATALAASFLASSAVEAQTPKRGGVITLATEQEPPNYDCTAVQSISSNYFASPIYSRLVRYDLAHYPDIVGDLAESWTVTPDGLVYTFKLRPNVKFHDGSILSAADVKASYERFRKPPPGVVTQRTEDFSDITSIETPDPLTIVIRLSERNRVLLSTFASPYNCIYSARRLADNPNYPATNLMGTGAFVPAEIVKGSHWSAKRFDGYFRQGLPYLDGFKWVLMAPTSHINAINAGQIDFVTRTMTPQEIDAIVTARGDKVAVKSAILTNMNNITINVARKPFDDVRVRRALTLAIDRRGGIEPMKKLSNAAAFGSLMPPGDQFELTDDEKAKLPGFGKDIQAARAEARKLLAEAGQSDLKFKLLTRPPLTSWMNNALFAIDQWRQIGVAVEPLIIDQSGVYVSMLIKGDFDLALDGNSVTSADPIVMLAKFTPEIGENFGKIADPMLSDLYTKMKQATATADLARATHAFETRTLEQAYIAPLFWAGWSLPIPRAIHGFQPSPSYNLGYDFTEVWRE